MENKPECLRVECRFCGATVTLDVAHLFREPKVPVSDDVCWILLPPVVEASDPTR
jgi:hypothetical protein